MIRFLAPAIARRPFFLAVIHLVLAVCPGLLRADKAVVRLSGLVVEAVEAPSAKVLPEYWPFSVRVRNTTREMRTLHGEIVLSARGAGGSEREVARCKVYREMRPQATEEWLLQCRSTEKYARWALEVRRVYPFIP